MNRLEDCSNKTAPLCRHNEAADLPASGAGSRKRPGSQTRTHRTAIINSAVAVITIRFLFAQHAQICGFPSHRTDIGRLNAINTNDILNDTRVHTRFPTGALRIKLRNIARKWVNTKSVDGACTTRGRVWTAQVV